MIWQLVRRDQDWRGLGFVTLCLWVGTLAGTVFFRPRVTAESLFSSTLSNMFLGCIVFGFMFGSNRRASLFQAALPIPARDLFVARLFSFVAGLWFILLNTAAACYVAGSGWSIPLLPLVIAAAMGAVTYLALLSPRLRELRVPTWMAWALLAGLGPAGYLVLFPGPLFSFSRPGIVLPVCAVAFAALLWRDLATMPKAFQIAPMDAVGAHPLNRRTGFVRPAWWPVWRSLSRGSPLATLIFSAMFLAAGMWSVVPVMLAAFLSAAWVSLRWLWPLPVDRRKILAMTLVPPLLLSAAVQMIWPGGFARAAGVVALTLLLTLAFLLPNQWNGRGSSVRSILELSFFALSIFVPAAMIVADAVLDESRPFGIHTRSYTADFLARHLAKLLPGHPMILIAGTLVALGALYWLVQRQFESADFVQYVQTRLDAADYSAGFKA